MTVGEAWACLGRDPGDVFRRIASHPTLDGRLQEAERALEEARKLARAMMAANHPDRGGDTAMFLKAQGALKAIEQSTESFRDTVARKKAEAELRAERKGTFIVKK